MNESDYWAFVETVRQSIGRAPISDIVAVRLEVTGSLATKTLSPPYSDLDLVLIAPTGAGPTVRDHVPHLAESTGRTLLAIFVDPLNPEACFCSIYRGPFKVDWWVFEEGQGSRRISIWRGTQPPPYDWTAHCWDWLWWLWGKARRGKEEIVRHELPRLWQFLTIKGLDARRFPPSLPEGITQSDFLTLIRRTMDCLPDPDSALGREIRVAIEQDAGGQ